MKTRKKNAFEHFVIFPASVKYMLIPKYHSLHWLLSHALGLAFPFPFPRPLLQIPALPMPFPCSPTGSGGSSPLCIQIAQTSSEPLPDVLLWQGLQPGKVPLLPPWERRAKEKSPASSQPCSQGDTANSHPPGHRGRDPHPKEEACHPHSSW